jgi:hypothetical protein
MAIPLTCACGAKLEFDDKFAGQTLNCPDCNRQLLVTPPGKPPERTSGLALASIILSLAGAFTVVGSLLGGVFGLLGLRQIARSPEPLGGRRLALAGAVLGGFFTVFTLGLLLFAEVLPLGGILRALEWAGKLEYPDTLKVTHDRGGVDLGEKIMIDRPSRSWGKMPARYKRPDAEQVDDLLLVNPWHDAYIVCITKHMDVPGEKEARESEAKDRFERSELITMLDSRPDKRQPLESKLRDEKKNINAEDTEMVLDIKVGGIERTFLIHVLKDGGRIRIVAGGTRKQRFPRLESLLRTALESFKVER